MSDWPVMAAAGEQDVMEASAVMVWATHSDCAQHGRNLVHNDRNVFELLRACHSQETVPAHLIPTYRHNDKWRKQLFNQATTSTMLALVVPSDKSPCKDTSFIRALHQSETSEALKFQSPTASAHVVMDEGLGLQKTQLNHKHFTGAYFELIRELEPGDRDESCKQKKGRVQGSKYASKRKNTEEGTKFTFKQVDPSLMLVQIIPKKSQIANTDDARVSPATTDVPEDQGDFEDISDDILHVSCDVECPNCKFLVNIGC